MRRSSPLTPGIHWDENAARYTDAVTGRFIARSAVRGELDQALDTSAANVQTLTERLRTGGLSVSQWQVAMAREVKSVHTASAALAKGGWAQMTPADWGRTGQKIKTQYTFLGKFAGEVSSGQQRLDGTLGRRAELYSQAGRNTYHAVEQREQARRGMTEERNLLAVSDHCPGCLDADAMGWVPIGELPEVGSRDCLSRCKCEIAYR